jgi:hypothetical protein
VFDLSGDFPSIFSADYSMRSSSCLPSDFSIVTNPLEMGIPRSNAQLMEVGHQGLAEPDHVVLEAAFDASSAVFRLVQQDLSPTGGDHGAFIMVSPGIHTRIVEASQAQGKAQVGRGLPISARRL